MKTLVHQAARSVALATATALAATTVVVGAASSASAVTPGGDASNWLAAELTNGVIYNPNFGGFDDYGLTIDTAFGINAVGGNSGVVRQIRDAMAPNISTYASFGASATAKALAFAQEAGADATSYGGNNLVAMTADYVNPAGPLAGRLENSPAEPDPANVIGQLFAARGLSVAGSAKAASAVSFLLRQQCGSGFFRLDFSAKAAPNQSCVDGVDAPNADVTSLALLQLAELPTKDAATTAAITKGVAWLKAQQRSDGSFGGGATTAESNSNSTGLAGWVLGDHGECVAAGRAGAWVQKLQLRNPAPGSPMAGEGGAIALNQHWYDVGTASGIASDEETEDRWRRATSQAAPALAYALGGTAASTFTGPTAFQREGAQATLSITGIGEGERVCLSGPGVSGQRSLVSSGSGTPVTSSVLLPGTTATPVYTLTTAVGTKTVAVKVLGKTKLEVKAKKKKVEKGDRQVIKVKGLEAGEKVTVRVRNQKVKTGHASAEGTFKAKFKIKKKLARLGRPKVVVTGEFKDLRKGTAYFRVRR